MANTNQNKVSVAILISNKAAGRSITTDKERLSIMIKGLIHQGKFFSTQ